MASSHRRPLTMSVVLNMLEVNTPLYPNPSLEEPPTPKRSRVEDPWYDCEFVHTPPDELVCPVCHHVARQPYQKNCCGRLFCKTCLKQNSDDVCPDCSGSAFEDARGERAIQSLLVKCKNTGNGCDWQGDLHSLNEHVNTCGFVLIPCPNKCTQDGGKLLEQILWKDLECHLDAECPNRKYKCPHCGVLGKHSKMTTTHLDVCYQMPFDCPNLCGETVRRCRLREHRSTCPLEEVDCKYMEICNAKRPRKFIAEHECNNNLHLSLAMNFIVKLKQVVANPFRQRVFKMSRFRSHRSSEKKWYSGLFYSHDKGGYKMCVSVHASSLLLCVHAHLMHGENDSDLVWPFRGSVAIQLLNQIQDKNHHTMSASYDNELEDELEGESEDEYYDGERRISRLMDTLDIDCLDYNTENECQYLKDDCLVLRVSSVEVYKCSKPWLTPH